jgi:hypothetical protein
MFISDPGSGIQGQKYSGSVSASKNLRSYPMIFLTQKTVFKAVGNIPDPGSRNHIFPIPDPYFSHSGSRVKKAPDPGSGSVTLDMWPCFSTREFN